MRLIKIIVITVLLTVGLIAILAELTVHDTSYAHLAANIVVKVCGVLMIVWAYDIIKHINDIEPLEVLYEDDSKDSIYTTEGEDIVGKDEEIE